MSLGVLRSVCVSKALPGIRTSANLFRSHPRRGVAMAAQQLEQAKIIPDLLDNVKESGVSLQVSYKGKTVTNGMHLTPAEAAAAPDVKVTAPQGDTALYTLVCSDPDPPDPANPSRREWVHWLVSNAPSGDIKRGTEVTPYMGPAPPTGDHRYVFMAFQQPNQEPLQAVDPSHGEQGKRAHFNTRRFATSHNLGDPVAVTWFMSHK